MSKTKLHLRSHMDYLNIDTSLPAAVGDPAAAVLTSGAPSAGSSGLGLC